MKKEMTPRTKWLELAAGGNPGPMVSPLCDDWSLNRPYEWPFEEPDPFPPGHPDHAVSQQMAMAGICGWEPTFLSGIECVPNNPQANPKYTTIPVASGSRMETRTETPYGPLISIVEHMVTSHSVKRELETREDYQRKAWVLRQLADHSLEAAIGQGTRLRNAIGERGVLGTWFGPPIANADHDKLFYHIMDWPEECHDLRQAGLEYSLKRVEVLRKSGMEYLFYCVDGTEWISPNFFREWILDDTRAILTRWRELGGFVLWHSCGKIKHFVEAGFYNELMPEVFETLSEPPVGNLPSLEWARTRLDSRIATKGNIALNVLLNGTPDEVRAEVRRVRRETRGYRHVVGLSDDVLKQTPIENAIAFAEEGHRE